MRRILPLLSLLPVLAVAQNNLQSGRQVPDFSLQRPDGTLVYKKEMMNEGDFFIYFVNVSDPLSRRATDWLNTHLAKYGGMKVKWKAVLNANSIGARKWTEANDPNMDVFIDPQRTLANLMGVRSAPTIVLVSRKGTALRTWSGWSGAGLKDLDRWIARVNGVRAKGADTRSAPNATRFGSPFSRSTSGG